MMAEGNDTPGGEPGHGAPRSERDLLAERRARRAADSGEVALTRRAEAAEATVQTLERHVASLQQRLREAEQAQRELAESLELERTAALEREHELRRVKQREYAEQQLRVEAEERLAGVDRESREEVDRITLRLEGGEAHAAELSERIAQIQAQLLDRAPAAAAERAAEHELGARVAQLERRAGELEQGLERERSARERAEQLLERMRTGQRQLGPLLGELKSVLARVLAGVEEERARRAGSGASAGATAVPREAPVSQAAPVSRAAPVSSEDPVSREVPAHDAAAPPEDAVAAVPATPAVPSPPPPPRPPSPRAAVPKAPAGNVAGEARGAEMADALAAAVERLRARAEVAPEFVEDRPQPAKPPPHKHTMSLIGRIGRWRKQRRSR
jgi:hypothetical protein